MENCRNGFAGNLSRQVEYVHKLRTMMILHSHSRMAETVDIAEVLPG